MRNQGEHCAFRAALAWVDGAPSSQLRGAFRCYPSFKRKFEEDREGEYYLPFWANPRDGDRHGWEGTEG